jgi:hypothetical protein
MIKTQQFHRRSRKRFMSKHDLETPPNAPEQRNVSFAQGEADPAKYPEDLEIGRFSTGQDESEPTARGSFAAGQATEPKAIDPDEGFAETDRTVVA